MKINKIKRHPGFFALTLSGICNSARNICRISNSAVRRVTFWFGVFLLLFVYQQKQLVFHFYFIEQEHLFLWSQDYFLSLIREHGGLVRWIEAFCAQFFMERYCGAFIMSAWLTATGMLAAAIIRRIAPASNLFITSLLPVIFLLFQHFDMNYRYCGTIAYTMMLALLYGYFCIPNLTGQVVYATVLGILLFWGFGAVAVLFLTAVVLWELMNRLNRAFFFIIPLLPVAGLVLWSIYTALAGNFRFLLLPDGYYSFRLRPGLALYFLWIYPVLLLLLCRFMRNRKPVRRRYKYVESSILLLAVTITFMLGMSRFVNRNSDFYKELDYYMRTAQWDRIIERCDGDVKNYLSMCCLNLALAEKGELSERMFSFTQQGVQGIFIPWNKALQSSVLLSDIYFSMGHIALAQRMAFEANVIMPDPGGPRMLKRLIQTSLIFGAYPVAEKYIDILEQTKYYRKWARNHRRFLWNDEAVGSDDLLGMKRRCIPKENFISEHLNVISDLENIALQNPAHQASIQYAGAFYLLSKEILPFREFAEKYYGTEALPTLPEPYQEAIVILSEQEPTILEQYAVSEAVVLRYQELRRQVITNRQNSAALPGLLKRSFGDTYWYYYMFK